MTTTRACSALMARNDTSVAGRGGPRVGQAAGRGVELPVVARRVKVEFDGAERPRGPELAVRADRPEVAHLGPASPDHELADPARPILVAIGVLWREPFVVVVVAVDDEVGARVVESLPEWLDRAIVAMESGTEARVVPDRERASRGRSREVGRKPAPLWRVRAATVHIPAIG